MHSSITMFKVSRFPYSVIRMSEKKIELYSVMNPAINSDSASTMSDGVLLVSASMVIKKNSIKIRFGYVMYVL